MEMTSSALALRRFIWTGSMLASLLLALVDGWCVEQVPAGRGTGHWQTIDATDGLKNNEVFAIVQAVDRDLVYSKQSATVLLTVHMPYERMGWISALGIAWP